jgi:hypothetical protein
MTTSYLPRMNGVMLCYSVDSRSSFDKLERWISMIKRFCRPNVAVLLIGTKIDLVDRRIISTEEGEKFAADHHWPYVETSSLTGEGVDEALAMMTALVTKPSFPLLWRGSVDGFGARDFHSRCDGKWPTLTVIRDTGGNVFGGFTDIAWASPKSREFRGSPISRSFFFTVKNPHNLAGRIFSLKKGKDESVIRVSSRLGPSFGDDDLVICDGCDVNACHCDGFGSTYTNDSGLNGQLLFTGAKKFKVSEIEVFSCDTK